MDKKEKKLFDDIAQSEWNNEEDHCSYNSRYELEESKRLAIDSYKEEKQDCAASSLNEGCDYMSEVESLRLDVPLSYKQRIFFMEDVNFTVVEIEKKFIERFIKYKKQNFDFYAIKGKKKIKLDCSGCHAILDHRSYPDSVSIFTRAKDMEHLKVIKKKLHKTQEDNIPNLETKKTAIGGQSLS